MTIGRGDSEHRADGDDAAAVAADLRMELIAAEREFIYRLLQEGQITDEARRRSNASSISKKLASPAKKKAASNRRHPPPQTILSGIAPRKSRLPTSTPQ